jgi:hypothetical protein
VPSSPKAANFFTVERPRAAKPEPAAHWSVVVPAYRASWRASVPALLPEQELAEKELRLLSLLLD